MRAVKFFLVIALFAGLGACEDPVPNDYNPQYAVEAILFVGEPIDGIKLLRTQNVRDTFSMTAAFIKDADVELLTGGDTLQLQYRDTEKGGEYWYPDSVYTVQPATTYRLRIRPAGGGLITGTTTTPGVIAFTRLVPDTVYYPKDTIDLPVDENLRLAWTPVPGVNEYILRVTALDTLEYGKYLTPPTEEKNRRVWRLRGGTRPEATRWALVPVTSLPGAWNAFKWFGIQDISVFAPDPNFIEWFKQIRFGGSSPTYNRLLGSVQGDEAVGVFASACIVSDTTFLIKNQP